MEKICYCHTPDYYSAIERLAVMICDTKYSHLGRGNLNRGIASMSLICGKVLGGIFLIND